MSAVQHVRRCMCSLKLCRVPCTCVDECGHAVIAVQCMSASLELMSFCLERVPLLCRFECGTCGAVVRQVRSEIVQGALPAHRDFGICGAVHECEPPAHESLPCIADGIVIFLETSLENSVREPRYLARVCTMRETASNTFRWH